MLTMDSIKGRINETAASTLQKPGFQFPGLTPRGEAQQARERDEEERQRARAPKPGGPPTTLREKLIPAPLEPAVQKVERLIKGEPSPAPSSQAAPSMPRLKEIALRQMGIKQAPSPQDAPGFKTYMDTLHTVVKNNRRDLTPAQQTQLITLIAQKLGGTWQPPQ
jgi:hypothetical protein